MEVRAPKGQYRVIGLDPVDTLTWPSGPLWKDCETPFSPGRPGEVSPTIISIAKHGSYSLGDLADILNRSHRSVGKSVRRLRAQGKIELDHGGFKLKG